MKIKKWLTTIIVALLVGGVIYHASRHAPTGPAEGVDLQGEVARPSAERRTLRIGTFNIHGCKDSDVDRVAECLRGLDFVALSEVYGPQTFEKQDQAQQLGERLGLAWLFAPAVRVWYHRESGNGLLSAVPVAFWQRIPLSRKHDRSHRNAVLVGLEHQGRTIHVLLSHINRRHDPERRAQLRAVIALYLALAEPAILMGDMNSDADDPQIRQLLETPGVADPVGDFLSRKTPNEETPRRIDWIFTRGFRCVEAGIRDNGASDHPMIWAELELLPESP